LLKGAGRIGESLMDALRGKRGVRDEAVKNVAESAGGTIQGGVEAGGDLSNLAASAAKEALEGAKEHGVTPEEAAAGVARGAIEAASGAGGDLAEEAVSAGAQGALVLIWVGSLAVRSGLGWERLWVLAWSSPRSPSGWHGTPLRRRPASVVT
jgi:hypothetical protein